MFDGCFLRDGEIGGIGGGPIGGGVGVVDLKIGVDDDRILALGVGEPFLTGGIDDFGEN